MLASAGFSGDDAGAADDTKRPSVQVGDPFEEKRLIEACLELLDTKLVVGIQDLGGAGLACATSETAGRGGVGMDVDVSAVPRREDGMEPWEVMTSESQERMLAIVTPESWPAVAAICAKWEVRATRHRQGDRTRARRRRAPAHPRRHGRPDPGRRAGRLALRRRAALRPPRQAPGRRTARAAARRPTDCARRPPGPAALGPAGSTASTTTSSSSTPWPGPGADAALLRLAGPGLPPSDAGRGAARPTPTRGPAPSIPRRGTALVLAEGVANLACVGATPVAVVNCLNFGNPEHPEVMWQLSECIDGMAEACRALSLPVIGGNVSLYNESGGADIDPTPVLGRARPGRRRPRAARPGLAWSDGDTVVLLGARRGAGRVASRWRGRAGPPSGATIAPGPIPSSTSPRTRRVCLRGRAGGRAGGRGGRRRLVHAVHDVSGGGLAVPLAEMAAAAGIGCARRRRPTAAPSSSPSCPSRFVVATGDARTSCAPGPRRAASRPPCWAGRGGDRLSPWARWSTSPSMARPRGARGEPRPGPGRTRDDAGLCENG